MRFEELVTKNAVNWPYPVNYSKATEVNCDVLVVGGGISGGWAAIGAAREGAKVVLVDKGAVISSGCGASGVDHWQSTPSNPACKFSPEEFTAIMLDNWEGNWNAVTSYIKSLSLTRSSWKLRNWA